MKVLINKTHEIEVDEKFRDMFPMKGCVGLRCVEDCPFGDYQLFSCRINSEIKGFISKNDFTAEIIEDKIKFEDLKIGQKVWYLEEEREILGLRKWDNPKRFITLRNHGYGYGWDEHDWEKIKNDIAFIPPKKKVTKTVEAWATVWEKGDGGIFGFRAHCEKYNKSNDKIKRALEILNRPYPELTNVDKVAMAKRVLEE